MDPQNIPNSTELKESMPPQNGAQSGGQPLTPQSRTMNSSPAISPVTTVASDTDQTTSLGREAQTIVSKDKHKIANNAKLMIGLGIPLIILGVLITLLGTFVGLAFVLIGVLSIVSGIISLKRAKK